MVASRLSEDSVLDVLVLEAGSDPGQLPEQLMQAVLTPAANSQLHKTPVDWDLKTTPQVTSDPHLLIGRQQHADGYERLISRTGRSAFPRERC